MAITYLKTASKTPETETDAARTVVSEMLAAIEAGGEAAVRGYALKLDRWNGSMLVHFSLTHRLLAPHSIHLSFTESSRPFTTLGVSCTRILW